MNVSTLSRFVLRHKMLVVTRWREECDNDYENELAVQRAMETAGHAVIFSGTTVGVGLLALIVLPIQMLRGIGIGGLVIPVVSVIATVTLLPVILATVGPKLDWPRNRRHVHHRPRGCCTESATARSFNRSTGAASFQWHPGTTLASRSSWERWAAAIVALAILGALLIPALQLEIGEPRPDSLNGPADAEAGMLALERSGIDVGVMDPFEIVVEGDSAPVAEAITGVDGVRGVIAPEADAWRNDNGALILFLAFVAMASGPETELKIMATVLATGILLDATIVRALLVPALVSLMGHWNWWLPSWLEWLAPKPATITGDERPGTASSRGMVTEPGA